MIRLGWAQNVAMPRTVSVRVSANRFSTGARHCLAVAVMSPIHIIFDGPVGWYCGGMGDGARITVNGSCGWSVGENLMSGTIDVHGNGGSSAGATLRGGRVFVAGTTGARSGISMKGGMLVVGGSVGYMSGFMMQRGTMIVCGDAADGIGDSMYEGTVYVGGSVHSLGADCVEAELTDDDRALLAAELDPHGITSTGVNSGRLRSTQALDSWSTAMTATDTSSQTSAFFPSR